MRISVRRNDRTIIVGMPGHGKTELGLHIFEGLVHSQRCAGVVVDPTGDGSLIRRWPVLYKPRDFTGLQLGQVIRVRPDVTPESCAEVFDAIWELRDVVVLIDELPLVGTESKSPLSLRRIYQQGRRRRIGVIALCQDPVRVPTYAFSLSEHKLIFRIQFPPYVERVARECGVDAAEMRTALGQLGDHDFLISSLRSDEKRLVHAPAIRI